jgi:hypothetical protein
VATAGEVGDAGDAGDADDGDDAQAAAETRIQIGGFIALFSG